MQEQIKKRINKQIKGENQNPTQENNVSTRNVTKQYKIYVI